MRYSHAIASSLFLFASTAAAWENINSYDALECAITNPNCYILDVRTPEEYRWVGHPGADKTGYGAELEGKVVNLPWEQVRLNVLVENPFFTAYARHYFGADKEHVVLVTMCRSGSRSAKAATALEALGFTVYNMQHGFEGDSDALGYRTINGWKMDGLPYNTKWDFYYPDIRPNRRAR